MKVCLSLLLEAVVNKLIPIIRVVLTKHYISLHESSINCLQLLANKMYVAGLVSLSVQHSPSFDIIIDEFISGLSFMGSLSQTEQYCATFLSIFTKLGHTCALVGEALQHDLIEDCRAECGVELQLGM